MGLHSRIRRRHDGASAFPRRPLLTLVLERAAARDGSVVGTGGGSAAAIQEEP